MGLCVRGYIGMLRRLVGTVNILSPTAIISPSSASHLEIPSALKIACQAIYAGDEADLILKYSMHIRYHGDTRER